MLTARFWRSRRAVSVAGIVFAVLLIAALTMVRIAVTEPTFGEIQHDAGRQTLIQISLALVPFAGIAFLWFIGVLREQVGMIDEDRLFTTVFLGSGLLFLATVFQAAVTFSAMLQMLAGPHPNADIWAFDQGTTQTLVSVYAMRMAAVFTFSVSTLVLRTRALPRWVAFLGYAVGLVLLVAAGEHKWTQLAFPGWVLLVSLVLLFTRPPDRQAEAPSTPPARRSGAGTPAG
jgi:hypothetical protein